MYTFGTNLLMCNTMYILQMSAPVTNGYILTIFSDSDTLAC